MSAHVAPPLVPDSERDSVRVQVLATEHWSLLSTRAILWNESFSRTGMFLTVVSASVVGLALVGQAADFGGDFRAFALFLLPLVLVLRVGTFVRLNDINDEEKMLVAGMNRLRHAYVALAPDLAPYFITGHHDDEAGILKTYSAFGEGLKPSRLLATTPVLVGVIDAAVAGILLGLIAKALGAGAAVTMTIGLVALVVGVAMVGRAELRRVDRMRRTYRPVFPSPDRVEPARRDWHPGGWPGASRVRPARARRSVAFVKETEARSANHQRHRRRTDPAHADPRRLALGEQLGDLRRLLPGARLRRLRARVAAEAG